MHPFFQGPQGAALRKLAETLWLNKYKVYLAGGCVRDFTLGRPYKDIDVVTDASVEQVQDLFAKTIPVGVQFGIVRVIIDQFEFEVARFRRDGPYQDGRHPEFVEFSEPEEDAARRDFTINALFFDLKTETVIDFVNGKQDLNAKVLKAVGDPAKRFSEDYLRILRLLRFACQLDFKIDEPTAAAARQLAHHIPQISGERIYVELTKALAAHPAKALQGLGDWNIPLILLPQWPVEKKDSTIGQKSLPATETNKVNDTSISSSFAVFAGHPEGGALLSMYLLNFYPETCREAIVVKSSMEWDYNKKYLHLITDFQKRLKFSNGDAQLLREAASVWAWPQAWHSIRRGYQIQLCQSEGFRLLQSIAKQSRAWPPEMLQEVEAMMALPRQVLLLTGQDVLCVAPEKRGLVLKECLYLQYEEVLRSREEALAWLKTQ